jgi:LmbE family N-acetylglucosaminyl deacetylase
MFHDDPLTGDEPRPFAVPRREFLKGSAVAAGTVLAGEATAAEKQGSTAPEKRKTFLAVGAHMDDAELHHGGVLIQAARAGHRVVIVTVVSDFSTWQRTKGREKEVRRDLLTLAEKFGFEKRFLDYPYHQIHGGDLELKRKLAEIYVELKPDAAFIHNENDTAPDHAACGEASRIAFMYSHGLSHDLTVQRCPLIYACAPYLQSQISLLGPEPDVYYDVTNVMPDWMELLVGTDCCLQGATPEQVVQAEYRMLGKVPITIRVSPHGLGAFAQAVRHGGRAGCRFAQGVCTVRGTYRGPDLF